jgi:DNA-binding NtrC family response regulator
MLTPILSLEFRRYKMNILIADKSFEIRAQLKEIKSIIYQNSKIQETESNLEAISILFNYCPSLIITDIDLEDGSGLSLLSFTTSITRKALVIVFTNHFMSRILWGQIIIYSLNKRS